MRVCVRALRVDRVVYSIGVDISSRFWNGVHSPDFTKGSFLFTLFDLRSNKCFVSGIFQLTKYRRTNLTVLVSPSAQVNIGCLSRLTHCIRVTFFFRVTFSLFQYCLFLPSIFQTLHISAYRPGGPFGPLHRHKQEIHIGEYGYRE